MNRLRDRLEPTRVLALLGALGLIGSFTAVLYGLVDVAGGTGQFGLLVAVSLVGATALAGVLRPRYAMLVAAVLLVAGLAWYLLSLPYVPEVVPIVESNLELLTGQSIHQIRQSAIWALGVVPAPVFVTWYFALRRWYGAAVLVGAAMLGFVVLSGDASLPVTLLGVVGGTAALGFGDLERHGGSNAGAEYVAVALAVMVAVPLVVTVVPASAGSPLSLVGGGGGGTVEASLLEDDAQLEVVGSLRLSPDVRFTIEAERSRYWKVGSFDRYTGTGWVRTGGTEPLADRSLPYPPGARETIVQRVEVESELTSLPAAWRPVGVGPSVANRTAVTALGDITATEPIEAGETYRVVSAIPDSWRELLAAAQAKYPATVSERYTQLPESTPDRVAERTARLTANATTPYTTALTIERWLERNREYSLDVDRPGENVADAFLFEMDRGYCVYYATTMTVMLRSQGIPARMATGYTTGQSVGSDRWVVRGLDAHAWVEVYFPDLGWVAFDPTPSGPRRGAELARIEEARENNLSSVDTAESSRVPETPAPAGDAAEPDDPVGPAATQASPDDEGSVIGLDPGLGGGAAPVSSGGGPELPPREHLALGAVLVVGLAAGVRRSGLGRWLVGTARLAWQRRADPATDVERAFARGRLVLERQHRPRRPGETVRQYLEAIDAPPAARDLARLRERAVYGGQVDRAMADEAVALGDELRDSYAAGLGRSRAENP